MELNKIHTEDCLLTMSDHIDEKSVDIVLTSPPYCTCNRGGKNSKNNLSKETHSNSKFYPTMRYDVFNDNMSEEEYVEWTLKLFNSFDRILKKDGCVLYNISYSSGRRDMLFLTIAAVLQKTNFSLADMIIWKKRTALPNNTSPNKLTRIIEPVFVFARKDDMDTFICNKKVTSVRERTGQKMYENIHNFIEAPNNDGMCKLNRATYSSELCEKLLNIYGKAGMTVYDPFMGTGTTAVACKRLGMNYIGSELSPGQTEFANRRIAEDSGVAGNYALTDKDVVDETSVEDADVVDRLPDGRVLTQMELFDANDVQQKIPSTDSVEDEADGVDSVAVTDCGNTSSERCNRVEQDSMLSNLEKGDEDGNEEDGGEAEEQDEKSGVEEEPDFKEELDECKEEEGYVINGYFHSHSTCPVGEDEFD